MPTTAEGLEADLAEQFLDTGKLGSPDAYARELRSSAGLPERSSTDPRKTAPSFGDTLRRTGHEFLMRVRTNPAANAVLEFLIKLRPVWWLLRAWAIFEITTVPFVGSNGFIPRGVAAWTYMLVLVVLSVRWGSKPAPARALARRTLNAFNVISIGFLVVMTPFILGHALSTPYTPPTNHQPNYGQGIVVNGSYAEHVFVYNKDGQLLNDLRFYDQDGQPIDIPIPGGLNPVPMQGPGQATPGMPLAPPTPAPGASVTTSPTRTPTPIQGSTAPSSTAIPPSGTS
ncbi:hypothetical protein [Arthrobacter sp. CJ23]|uniref:hypothetical protein n=1 Tax=Arthrobacter sp. CJ23 TaxID=2972479 RepID=UPI00215CCDE9|nr:hypothetical protein [Arthrobacter sp. CJ23]UVJ38488.1 hypothetical protein NVV90_14790 [Arthrobacter sp. CJ23]